ncbi:MAG: universal stress protein [Hahellaceae bacterium]|nr:universal stress protein [Hahellaceae bacterium]
MEIYQNILVAIDLSEESVQVLSKAAKLAKNSNAQLSIIHVIEPLGYAYGGDIPMDLSEVQQQLDQHARAKLAKFGETYDVPLANQFIEIGKPETEIHRIANEKNMDIVIVGSHGRHGFQLLLGSTANAVLHGSQCDVLAVRVGK